MRKEILQKKYSILYSVALLLITAGNAFAQTATGVLIDNELSYYRYLYAHIDLTLETESIVSMEYTVTCNSPENAEMAIYNISDNNQKVGWAKITEITQPWTPIPLAAGDYRIQLSCKNQRYYSNSIPVEYSLDYSYVSGTSFFIKDSEPNLTIDDAIDIGDGQTAEGWLGYMGYAVLRDYDADLSSGLPDNHDRYYYNVTEGSKIKFKLEYDDSFIDNPQFATSTEPGDMEIIPVLTKANGSYVRVGYFDLWQSSGHVSEEITIDADGVLMVQVGGGWPGKDLYESRQNFPKTNYGGYKLTVIIDGVEPPPPSPPTPPVDLEIYRIKSIITADIDEPDKVTNELIPGKVSDILAVVHNSSDYGGKVKFTYGLSVDGGNIQEIGSSVLSVIPDNFPDPVPIYLSEVTTPYNASGSATGQLVLVLHDATTGTLIDTYTTSVKIKLTRKMGINMGALLLLLNTAGAFD